MIDVRFVRNEDVDAPKLYWVRARDDLRYKVLIS